MLRTIQGIIPLKEIYSVLEATLRKFRPTPTNYLDHISNILKLPKPTKPASSLKQFCNSLMYLRSLYKLKINVSAWAPFIIPIIEDKLPGKIRGSIGGSGHGVQFDLKLSMDSLKDFIS